MDSMLWMVHLSKLMRDLMDMPNFLRKKRRYCAFLTVAFTWEVQDRLSVIVTPRNLMFSTFSTLSGLMVILKALFVVLNHDISSRICDVGLNVIDCLLQLEVVPSADKKYKIEENKENNTDEKRQKEATSQRAAPTGSSGTFGAPPEDGNGNASGGGDGGGGGGGGGGDDGDKKSKNQEKQRAHNGIAQGIVNAHTSHS
eukprot:g41824.t1